MNSPRISAMPSISENTVTWEASSQEAAQEGSWHNSDAAQNAIHAARLESTLRAAEVPSHQSTQPPQAPTQPNQPPETRKAWRTIFHRASLACGIAILPSFACLAIGPLGLIAPAGLAVLFVAFELLSGKANEAERAQINSARAALQNFDFRGMT